jgi:hypothetical protein
MEYGIGWLKAIMPRRRTKGSRIPMAPTILRRLRYEMMKLLGCP